MAMINKQIVLVMLGELLREGMIQLGEEKSRMGISPILHAYPSGRVIDQ